MWIQERCEARRVGGRCGDDGGYRASVAGRFPHRAPSRDKYSYGPRDRGLGAIGFDGPCFGRCGVG